VSVRSFTLHGYTVSAHWQGSSDPAAPLVVLVHGMMEPPRVWETLVPRLTADPPAWRCVSLELPWNGLQGGLWGRSLTPQQWLRAALERFELQADAWVAHSFGASTLLSLLAEQPDAPGAQAPAVLISPFFKRRPQDVSWPLFQRYVNEFQKFVELSLRVRLEGRPVDAAVLARMTETARDAFGCYVWMEFWRLFSAMPFLPLQRVEQPLLLLGGAQDFSAPVADLRVLAEALPSATLQSYPEASHFLLSTHGAAVADAVSTFFSLVCPLVRDETSFA